MNLFTQIDGTHHCRLLHVSGKGMFYDLLYSSNYSIKPLMQPYTLTAHTEQCLMMLLDFKSALKMIKKRFKYNLATNIHQTDRFVP